MPYERLPARLRQLIPSERGQEIFRNTVNSQLDAGRSEAVSMASAWSALRRAGFERDNATGKWERVEKSRKETLEDKVREHNAEHGDKGRVTLSMLEQVYDRGVGAYRTNPSSVRPNVTSPEQWAYARVKTFLQAIRTGKFPSGKFDTDLLPKEHPLSTRKSQPSVSSVHVPSADWERTRKEDTFRPPAGARAAARRAIRWKEKYGDKVRGGTQVGWTRAGQLARGENLSRETVARMASFFARHRGNEAVDPKFKDEPWRDNGYIMHLAWGGSAGREWSQGIMDRINKRQIDDDSFTDPASAVVRSMDLGLGGEIHVHDRNGQAVYMPGENHEDYLERIAQIAGIESPEQDDYEGEKQGLLERGISAIIAAIMQHTPVTKSQVNAQVLKMDDEQRIVWGWAYVSTEDGKLLVDTQGDSIEPVEMEKMSSEFMEKSRNAKVMHNGEVVAQVIHSFPLTKELMKAFDIYSDREGWITGTKVYDDETWEKVRKGELPALSIGGRALDVEEYDAA
jgi:hypothetical protein